MSKAKGEITQAEYLSLKNGAEQTYAEGHQRGGWGLCGIVLLLGRRRVSRIEDEQIGHYGVVLETPTPYSLIRYSLPYFS